MSKEDNQIAAIVPAAKLPRTLTPFFSYRVPSALRSTLRAGDAVRVPFGRRSILGIVDSFSAQAPAEVALKEIEAVVPELSLSEEQLAIARHIAEHYFVPLGSVLRLMLPAIPPKPSRKPIELAAECPLPEGDASQLAALADRLEASERTLLLHSLQTERHRLYLELVRRQTPDAQTLLMLPEYFDLYAIAPFYLRELGREQVAILCGDLTANQYYEEWQKVRSGQARLLISTRQGVLAPLRNLRRIIVDEEHNSSYKQWDQNPRYHGVDTAIRLAATTGARITLSSPTPTLESYGHTREDFVLVDVSRPLSTPLRLLDFATERGFGNRAFVFEELKRELLEKVYAHQQALVLVPRLGEKTLHQCRDCGAVAECAVCHNPLIGYKGKLFCSRCKELHESLPVCPKCGSQNIGSFGGGSQCVAEEIAALFEGKNIRVVELDSSTAADSKRGQKMLADFQRGRIDVLVGTQMVWKNWDMPRLGLVAVIFPEIIFNAPGFRSRERARQFLVRLCGLAQGRTVILETHKPDHRYYTELRAQSAVAFLEEELAARASGLSSIPYPPLGRMIKFICKDADARACEREAKYLYELLKREIWEQRLGEDFEAMPPFPAQNFRAFGKYRWHLILKHRQDADRSTRDRLLALANEKWIHDVDPDEIL